MSKSSIAETFIEYRKRLLNFIRSRVNRLEDAEDILQDVFYQYVCADNMLNPIENTAAWLYRVARNKIIDLRKKKKEESLDLHYYEDEDDYIFEEIEAALAELPKEQRQVFEMTELLGFSVKEVAEITGAPVNTVLSRKHYAVKQLRKFLNS